VAKQPSYKRSPSADALAWTVAEWCALNRYSRSFYERMKRAGRGPRVTREGTTVRITPEADAEWRAARETKSA
jgi:hypothetical protein